MHMINTKTLQLSSFPSEDGVKFAILSHRWLQAPLEEVLFEDMCNLEQCTKAAGIDKIRSFCALAAKMGYEWCWMDTCCIDKRSSAELSEAINSMYRWYKAADVCIAYMADVIYQVYVEEEFKKSDWFRRCWTLQELLAPDVDRFFFYNAGWRRLASKRELSRLVSNITGIDESALRGACLSDYSIAERMRWAAHRRATRVEDEAYSLMGIFDVNMSMLYGEGKRAFERLCETIIQYTNDETIFAWSADHNLSHLTGGLLAPSPYYYKDCRGLKPMNLFHRKNGFTLTSRGLTSTVMMVSDHSEDVHRAFLNAAFVTEDSERYVAIHLNRDGHHPDEYVRNMSNAELRALTTASHSDVSRLDLEPVKVYVRHRGHQKVHATSLPHGVNLKELLQSRTFGNLDPRFRFYMSSLKMAPGCEENHIKHMYRPSGRPHGPLCNVDLSSHNTYNSYVMQLGIYGDFFASSPVILVLEESSWARSNLLDDLRGFKTDYSTVDWSVVGIHDEIESESGFFALKLRHGCVAKCIRKTRKTTKIGKTMVVSYKFGVEAKLISEDSQLLWEVKVVPVS